MFKTKEEKIIAKAFEAWLEDYIKNPESFEPEIKTIMRKLKSKGKKCTYGNLCVETLKSYISKVI